MELIYAGLAIGLVLLLKPLVWVPLLFSLDRLAGMIGPRFRHKVSGHYAEKPLRYFFVAQYNGPKAAKQDLEQRRPAPPLERL
jgi:hypothetical protein